MPELHQPETVDERPILVADDEPDILDLVCLRLERAGHSTRQAQNGHEALRLAEERTPKMCVLDLVMPGMGGLELCQRLRAMPETAEIPILLLSASVQEAEVERGLQIGADAYLRKPFQTQEFLEYVATLLAGGRPGEAYSG